MIKKKIILMKDKLDENHDRLCKIGIKSGCKKVPGTKSVWLQIWRLQKIFIREKVTQRKQLRFKSKNNEATTERVKEIALIKMVTEKFKQMIV